MAKILWPRMDRKIGKLFEIYEEAKMGVDTKATVLITPEKVAAFVEASENLIERYQKTLLEVKRLTLYIAAEILPSPRANEMASLRRDLFICVLCKKIVGRHVEYLRHDETDVYFLGRLSEEIGKGKECSCEHAFDVENGNVVYKIEMKKLQFWNDVQMMTASEHFEHVNEDNDSESDDDDVEDAVDPDDDNEDGVDDEDE